MAYEKYLMVAFSLLMLGCKKEKAQSIQTQPTPTNQPSADISLNARLNSTVAASGNRFGIPNIVLKVKNSNTDETIVFNAGYSPEQASVNAYFRIGSITKTVVATLLLKQQEAGLVDLNNSILPYFNFPPGTVYNAQNISISNLLNHSSGIGDFVPSIMRNTTDIMGQIGSYWLYPSKEYTGIELLSLIYSPQTTSNLTHQYSNTNYLLAGKIAEQLDNPQNVPSAVPKLQSAINKLLLTPGSVTELLYLENELTIPGLVSGYEKFPTRIENVSAVHPSAMNSAGAIAATANGITDFIQKLFEGKIINQNSLLQMTAKYFPSGNNNHAGLGVFIGQHSKAGVHYFHSGALPGYLSYYVHFPKNNTTVVLLMNTYTNPGASRAQSEIIDATINALFP